jgi:hypothetical protein
VNAGHKFLKLIPAAAVLALASPAPAVACATCFGQSDSPLAQGLNWGIFTLLGVVLAVLGSALTFFIHLIRKESASLKDAASQNPPEI